MTPEEIGKLTPYQVRNIYLKALEQEKDANDWVGDFMKKARSGRLREADFLLE